MNLVLDTHTIIWAVDQPTQLSSTAGLALQDPKKSNYVSDWQQLASFSPSPNGVLTVRRYFNQIPFFFVFPHKLFHFCRRELLCVSCGGPVWKNI